MGDEPGRNTVPAPFVGWRTSFSFESCPTTHVTDSGVVELSVESGLRCVTGVIGGEWGRSVLAVGALLEVVATGREGPPGVALAEPHEGLTIRPRTDVWEAVLGDYRRRIVMLVSEGAFFAILLLVLIGLLWRSFRREVELERQHRNFLSAVTHELKSPLASMRLALETVATDRASPEAGKRFIGNALEDVERLQDLVEKVLEATRFGEGWTEIHLEDTDLSRLVEDSIEAFRRRAMAANALLRSDISPDIHKKENLSSSNTFIFEVNSEMERIWRWGVLVVAVMHYTIGRTISITSDKIYYVNFLPWALIWFFMGVFGGARI